MSQGLNCSPRGLGRVGISTSAQESDAEEQRRVQLRDQAYQNLRQQEDTYPTGLPTIGESTTYDGQALSESVAVQPTTALRSAGRGLHRTLPTWAGGPRSLAVHVHETRSVVRSTTIDGMSSAASTITMDSYDNDMLPLASQSVQQPIPPAKAPSVPIVPITLPTRNGGTSVPTSELSFSASDLSAIRGLPAVQAADDDLDAVEDAGGEPEAEEGLDTRIALAAAAL